MKKTVIIIAFTLLCLYQYLTSTDITVRTISVALMSFCIVCISDIFSFQNNNSIPHRIFKELCFCAMSIYAMFDFDIAYLLPVYAIYYYPGKIYIAPLLNLLTYSHIIAYTHTPSCALPLILSVICYILGLILEELAMQKKALQNIRDFSMEKTMSLEEKNQALIEQQDNEVLAATLKERNRIAREIHDNVGHMLTRSILQMGAIKVINKDEKLSPALEDLHSTLNLAMTNIRSSVHDLHDESIDLKAALKDILENVGKFTTNLDYDVHDQIPRNIKYAFIAITKEAVNNAVKHSNGNNITVIVNDQPGFYKLLIKDNGSVKKINVNNGIGLSNMRDRANSINGIFKMTTQNGVTVMVTVMK